MPNQRALDLARVILDDLGGSGYYADPKVLSGLLTGYMDTEAACENAAIEILRQMLRHYARQGMSSHASEELAEQLASYGVQ
jgi:hypothetical protein